MLEFVTTRAVADEISSSRLIVGVVREWQVRRLYEDGDLEEPSRFAGHRAIPRTDLPMIVAAIRRRGWLPTEDSPGEAISS